MNKDKDIEKLFAAAPSSGREDVFMHELERKMDVVDIVRGEHGSAMRFYQMFAVVSFAVGLLSGGGLLYFAVLQPIDWQVFVSLFGVELSKHVLLFCAHYGKLCLSVLACMIIIWGALPIIKSDFKLPLSSIILLVSKK